MFNWFLVLTDTFEIFLDQITSAIKIVTSMKEQNLLFLFCYVVLLEMKAKTELLYLGYRERPQNCMATFFSGRPTCTSLLPQGTSLENGNA